MLKDRHPDVAGASLPKAPPQTSQHEAGVAERASERGSSEGTATRLPAEFDDGTIDASADAWLQDHSPTDCVPVCPMMAVAGDVLTAAGREKVVGPADVEISSWIQPVDGSTSERMLTRKVRLKDHFAHTPQAPPGRGAHRRQQGVSGRCASYSRRSYSSPMGGRIAIPDRLAPTRRLIAAGAV
jgi:hypothetical protein